MIAATFGMPLAEVEDMSFREIQRQVNLVVWYENRGAAADGDSHSVVMDMIRRGKGSKR